MNRAEFRRQKRKAEEKKRVYTLTYDDIVRLKKEAAREAMDVAFVCMLAIPCLTMHDVFGFGKTRLTRMMDSFMTKYDCFMDDFDKKGDERFDFDAMIKIVKDETGYDILKKLERKEMLA